MTIFYSENCTYLILATSISHRVLHNIIALKRRDFLGFYYFYRWRIREYLILASSYITVKAAFRTGNFVFDSCINKKTTYHPLNKCLNLTETITNLILNDIVSGNHEYPSFRRQFRWFLRFFGKVSGQNVNLTWRVFGIERADG